MATFRLEGDDAPEENAPPASPASPSAPRSTPASPEANEFSFFLDDEPKPSAASSTPSQSQSQTQRSTSPAPVQSRPAPVSGPSAPAQPAVDPPTRVVAPVPTPPAQGGAPASPRAAAPTPGQPNPARPAQGVQPAQPSPPNLMRPAQQKGPRADPSQPPGLNVPAAIADTPILTQPDAASIAQSAEPSDDFASGIQEFASKIKGVLDAGSDLFTWAARLALPIAALSLAYILAAMFTGGAANTNPQITQVLHFLQIASQAFAASLFVLAVSMLLLAYEDNRLGAIVAASGVFLSFGLLLVLRTVLGADNYAAKVIASQFLGTGRWLLFLGGFKALLDVSVWLWNLPNTIKSRQSAAGAVGFGKTVEAKQQRIARRANMFSPCWGLPFCREAIRVLCPAYLARKTCWKFGRGCYCDEEMVGRIVRNEPIDAIKAANTRQSKEPPPCARCYIFLEHQTHKFRMMSPLALPAAIAIMFAAWPIYNTLFSGFTKAYIALFKTLSFSPKAPDAIKASKDSQDALANAQALSPEQLAQFSSYVLAALMGFFLLIYISKFIEWAIFKAKW